MILYSFYFLQLCKKSGAKKYYFEKSYVQQRSKTFVILKKGVAKYLLHLFNIPTCLNRTGDNLITFLRHLQSNALPTELKSGKCC